MSGELFSNPKTYSLIQKRPPYTGNVNSVTTGDSKTAFKHCGHVLNLCHLAQLDPTSIPNVLTAPMCVYGSHSQDVPQSS